MVSSNAFDGTRDIMLNTYRLSGLGSLHYRLLLYRLLHCSLVVLSVSNVCLVCEFPFCVTCSMWLAVSWVCSVCHISPMWPCRQCSLCICVFVMLLFTSMCLFPFIYPVSCDTLVLAASYLYSLVWVLMFCNVLYCISNNPGTKNYKQEANPGAMANFLNFLDMLI